MRFSSHTFHLNVTRYITRSDEVFMSHNATLENNKGHFKQECHSVGRHELKRTVFCHYEVLALCHFFFKSSVSCLIKRERKQWLGFYVFFFPFPLDMSFNCNKRLHRERKCWFSLSQVALTQNAKWKIWRQLITWMKQRVGFERALFSRALLLFFLKIIVHKEMQPLPEFIFWLWFARV